MIKNKRIFITGGAGFIASTLIGKLIEDNEIIVFDTFSRDSLSSKPYHEHKNLIKVEGNVLDVQKLKESIKGSNLIIHAAAIAGIDNTVRNPVNTLKVNILGTCNVLEAAINEKGIERFLGFSTSEVFGSYAYKVEEINQTIIGAVGEARWTYSVSKLAGEHLTHAYHKYYGLPTVTLRPFNIYGPGQLGEGAIQIFIRKALLDEELVIFGDGTQIRAWCYIDDMIDGILKSLSDEKSIGESFNIGNSKAITTIFGLAETVCRVLKSSSKIIFKEPLSADIELRIPKVDKAKRLIGFEAKIDLEEGILKTAEWYKKNLKNLPELPSIFKK